MDDKSLVVKRFLAGPRGSVLQFRPAGQGAGGGGGAKAD